MMELETSLVAGAVQGLSTGAVLVMFLNSLDRRLANIERAILAFGRGKTKVNDDET